MSDSGESAARDSQVEAIISSGQKRIDRYVVSTLMSIHDGGCPLGKVNSQKITALENGPIKRAVVGTTVTATAVTSVIVGVIEAIKHFTK